jgi:outer membrane protein, heavy metal efflux system
MSTLATRRCLLPIAAAMLLGACAHLPVDGGRDAVAGQLAAAGLPDELPPSTRIDGIDPTVVAYLDAPLSEADALAVAFAASPRVRAELARVGVAAADWLAARRPRNPGIEWSRLGEEYGLGLHVGLADLLTLPIRRGVAEAQWRADLADVAATLAEEATAVRRAYWRHAAAEQVAAMREAAAEAAALSAEMARRVHAAGNASALQLAREEAEAAVAAHAAARARADRLEARMALAEHLGLAGISNRWRVPTQLPLPPGTVPSIDALLASALAARPDLEATRHRCARC